MFKPALKNNRILRSQQVLNALIVILRRYLPLDMKNTRITAEDIIAILGYASAHRISISSSRKGLNMVYLALTKETKPPCSNPRLKITESCDLNKY